MTASSPARGGIKHAGTIAFLAALGLALAGGVSLGLNRGRVLVREAMIDGFSLRMDQARWLVDQMDHDQTFPMPAIMAPGLPPSGIHRLSVELALANSGHEPRAFRANEVMLVAGDGARWEPSGGDIAATELRPGLALNAAIFFDVPETKEDLVLLWSRGEASARLPIPHPPFHDDLERVKWPEPVTSLARGQAKRGQDLFTNVYGCAACHGAPGDPHSNTLGPHLGAIGREGAHRIPGMTSAQYVYESILEPTAFTAPACKDGRPCIQPSVMPEYRELLSEKDMADLVAFLEENQS